MADNQNVASESDAASVRAPLLSDAWKRRHNLRLVDALYVELADRLGTTDTGLAAATPAAQLITNPIKTMRIAST